MKKTLLIISVLILTLTSNSQTALNFDGSGDYVQTNYDGVLGTNARTFEAWIYIDTNVSATTNYCILDYGPGPAGNRNTFYYKGNGQIGYLSGGTNGNMGSPTGLVPFRKWTHVAFVLNNGTGYLYINTVQVATNNLSAVNTTSGGTKVRIGEKVPSNSIAFKGSIDEVRIWDVARTPAQMAADTLGEICTLQPNLKAYYRFNEGVAGGTNTGITTVIDYAGTNNGTFNGFTLTGSTSNYDTGKMLTPGYEKTTFQDSLCGPYTTMNGTVYTTTGIYYDTLTNSTSCDSLIEYDLNISSVNDSVYRTGGRIDSWDSFANHQWVRCDSNYAPIAGATNRFYTATVTGDYAVIVSRNACVDTSECINISLTSIEKNSLNQISIFPNPTNNILNVVGLLNDITYKIYSINGKLIESGTLNESTIDVSTFENGVYFLQLESKEGNSTIKFVKK
ncbi:T9SS type A sorting domain-containing protein [bacterium]|nr:T9SS type A sorting domain-containing protein [bacterium]